MRFAEHLWIVAIAIFVCLLAPIAALASPIDPTSSTDDWVVIPYSMLVSDPDYSDDQQTGQHDSDIVGNDVDAALYVAFDSAGQGSDTDGTIGFRVRLGGSKKGAFEHVFVIGLDADMDGAIDLFLGVDNSGNGADIGIWDAGSDFNTSPDTTSIVSTPIQSWSEVAGVNYDYSPVDIGNDPDASTFDVDGDTENDYFLSFTIDFQAVVNAVVALGVGFENFNDESDFQLVAATSNQINALNNDLGGPDGGIGSSDSWATLGAISEPFDAASVPEPSTGVLLGLGLIGLSALRRRRG